jgi:hypothetical protein
MFHVEHLKREALEYRAFNEINQVVLADRRVRRDSAVHNETAAFLNLGVSAFPEACFGEFQ